MHIDDLRKLIKKEDFRCMEIHDRLNNDIIFVFMTKGDKVTINVTYNRDVDGFFGFSHLNEVQVSFEFYKGYVESTLICGQCSSIKYHRGRKLVDYYHEDN